MESHTFLRLLFLPLKGFKVVGTNCERDLGDDSVASQAKLHCYLERLLFEVTPKHEPSRASVFV